MRTRQWYARHHPAAETPRPSPFAQRRRIIAPVPRDAFISHASVDAELAFAICVGLEKRGLTCWIAPRYDYLTEVGDVNWRPVIPDALKGAMTNVGIQNQKPESPLKTTPTTKPVVPASKKE